MKRYTYWILSLLVVASMLLAACQTATPAPTEAATEAPAATEAVTEAPEATEAPTEEPVATEAPTEEPTAVPTEPPAPATTRKGGWLDEIVYSVVARDSVVTQLTADAIDIYANGLSAVDLPAIQDADLSYSTASGLYYSLLFNPAGPTFADGRLNPFSSLKMREAMNYIIDRDYINQEIYNGGALPKWFAITTQFPDYADQADVARRLEATYAYSMEKAKEIMDAEMATLGAELVDGKWNFDGEPVTLIFIIRNDSDGTRLPIGDYVASQMETLGFTVDRQYKTGSEASPIWIGSEPTEGQWHFYTAAWSATVLDRDQSNIFQEMYLPTSAQGISAFLQNVPDPEFQELGDALANANFTTVEQRHDMMSRALELSLQDSFQVFIIDGKNYIPYQENVVATADLAAGVEGSQIYPFTLRFEGEEGGSMRWATQDLFAEPWNPVAGSNWAFDQGVIRATNSASGEVVYDPFTGLVWPMRMESAVVTAQEGLPISKTLDWVTLETAPEIAVPEDAWVDWDAETQLFITAGEKFPDGLTAKVKTVQTYPADMFETVKWHDGSTLDMADIVMGMIMTFDRAKEASAIYDEQAVPRVELFLENFKGFKIVSTDPLVTEYYTDSYSLDAELNIGVFYPTYTFAEGSFPMITIGNMAEAGGELAYSSDKATAAEIEQTSFVGGPSLEILAKYLDQAIAEQTIPYAPTMSEYITAEQAVARYEAYKAWYTEKSHFWVGTGPYYLDQPFLTEKTAVVKHFEEYPDMADRWSDFGEPKIAVVELDGPGQVTIGEEAQFDVFVDFNDAPYPADQIRSVRYLLHNAAGEIVAVEDAELVEDGVYKVVLTAEATAALEAGSNMLEVAVVPLPVSQPTFTSMEFVTAP